MTRVLSDKEKKKIFDGNVISYVDEGFFSMFSFRFLKGNKATAFPNNNAVVLTQSTAQKLFGDADPIGKAVGFHKTTLQ